MQRLSTKDAVTVSTRTKDARGFLVADAVLSRCGLQPYRRSELKGLDGDPNGLVWLMRTPEEVFSEKAVASAERAPLTLGHPRDGVTPKSYAALNKGEAYDCKRLAGDMLGSKIIAKAEDAIARIESKTAALSLGYTFDFDPTPGTYNGQAYDGLQRNIEINHVAIVDVARGGPNCRVLDEGTNNGEDKHMKKLVLDGQLFEVEDALFDKVKEMEKKIADNATKAVGDSAAHVALVQERDNLKLEVETLKKRPQGVSDEVAEMRAEAKMRFIKAADGLGVKLEGKGKQLPALHREMISALMAADGAAKDVIGAVLGATKVEAADDVTLATLCASLIAMPKVNAQDATMAALLENAPAVDAPGATPVQADDGLDGLIVRDGPVVRKDGQKFVGRDAMIEKQKQLNNSHTGAAKR